MLLCPVELAALVGIISVGHVSINVVTNLIKSCAKSETQKVKVNLKFTFRKQSLEKGLGGLVVEVGTDSCNVNPSAPPAFVIEQTNVYKHRDDVEKGNAKNDESPSTETITLSKHHDTNICSCMTCRMWNFVRKNVSVAVAATAFIFVDQLVVIVLIRHLLKMTTDIKMMVSR